jgi:murein DD-endopeptidase MepM/ murein hydrolase activator NlpD
MPKLTASSASGFIMPTNGELSSSFGYRRHPILGTVRLHAGTDLGASYGTPIWAAKDGEVIFAGWNGGYGNCVIVAHEGGISTLYGHQSEIAVSVGQQVSQGEIIGYVGSTGQSTGPHLHFEVRVGGEPEDPMLFL